MSSLSAEEVRSITRETVRETLSALGIEVNNQLQAQADFAAMRVLAALARDEEFEKDLAHVRKWRKAMESVHSKGFLTLVGLIAAGCASVFVVGLKSIFGR